MKKRVMLSWSSGKDSAWTLYQLRQQTEYEVVGLFSTVNMTHDRVAMHAVRTELLRQQAARVGLPLDIIEIPGPCSNAEYEACMSNFVARCQQRSIDCFAFGDLYLEDIRAYREEKLAGCDIEAIFPLWDVPTNALCREMVDSGLRAHLTCVDPQQLSPQFAGREFNHALLDALPVGVDPCGENGEFHTFVSAGPMFDGGVDVTVGEVVTRDGFVFADLLPAEKKGTSDAA